MTDPIIGSNLTNNILEETATILDSILIWYELLPVGNAAPTSAQLI